MIITTNYSVNSVDGYILSTQKEARSHLREIRTAVKSAVPKAEEGTRYSKPYYKYHGMIAGFDEFKEHISFEVWTDELQSEDRQMLEEKVIKLVKEPFK